MLFIQKSNFIPPKCLGLNFSCASNFIQLFRDSVMRFSILIFYLGGLLSYFQIGFQFCWDIWTQFKFLYSAVWMTPWSSFASKNFCLLTPLFKTSILLREVFDFYSDVCILTPGCQRAQCSFQKNIKERKECSVLFKRT